MLLRTQGRWTTFCLAHSLHLVPSMWATSPCACESLCWELVGSQPWHGEAHSELSSGLMIPLLCIQGRGTHPVSYAGDHVRLRKSGCMLPV